MAGNYYAPAFAYGTSFSQSQPFQEQYPSTGTQSSQSYYSNEHPQTNKASSAARPSALEHRHATTQYNGLHFPAPTPVRQTGTSNDGSRAAGATSGVAGSVTGRSHEPATGYGSAGLYQSSTNSTSSQPSRPRTDGAARHHDRAEQALSAAGWNAGSSASSVSNTVSGAAPSTDYGYSYQKSDPVSQQTYYGAQRSSATNTLQSAPVHTSYDHAASYNSSAQRTQASNAADSRHSQPYRQTAQSTASASYGRAYENTPSRTDMSSLSAGGHHQTSEYGRTYQDDTEQNQSYLQHIYTLPQPTPSRTTAETTNSYFSSAHSSEPSYVSSSQPAKPSTHHQTTYERPMRDSARDDNIAPPSTHSYTATTSSRPNQQWYQNHNPRDSTQSHGLIPGHISSSAPTTQTVASTAPAAPVPASQQTTSSAPQHASQPKKQRVSASQKSPTARPRASRKAKAGATVTASPPVVDLTASSEPPQHTFYPAASTSSSQPPSMHRNPGAEKSGKATTSKSSVPVQALTINVAPVSDTVSGQPPSGSSEPMMDLASMEQHMREMVEKMREYQQKDPTAFQQVWENVKRSGPAAAGAKNAAPLPISASTSTPGMNSPSQGVASLAKPPRQPGHQSATATATLDGGRNTPVPGSAASEAQKTVWPATKKVALSKTASKFFANHGQKCSESVIMSLLDFGPTFSELCQKLEAKGYKFERNKFAIELLKTTDSESLAGGKATASTAAPAISAATPATSIVPSSVPTATTTTHSTDPHTQFITPQSIKSFNPRNIKDSIPSFPPPDNSYDPLNNFVAPSMIYREVYPTHFSQPESNVRSEEQSTAPAPAHSPSPAPASPELSIPAPVSVPERTKRKKSMSKKRVSLAKQSQIPSNGAIETPHTPTLTIAMTTSQVPVAPQPSFPPADREEAMPDASPVAMAPPISRLEPLYNSQTAQMPYVQPNAEDSDALLRLQSKLQAQLSKFETLEAPRQPPPPLQRTLPSSRPPMPQPPPSRKTVLQKPPALDSKKALRRNTYDSQTIVHAVLLATGRHPMYEGLNNRMGILKKVHPKSFDNNTDLAQLPWDVYDPPPAPLPGEEKKGKRSVIVDEGESRGRKRERDPVPFTPGTLRADPETLTPTPSEGTTRGKRGRPRGSRGVTRGSARGRESAIGHRAGSVQGHASGADSSTAANAHKYGTVTRVNINTLNRGSNGGGDGAGKKRKHGDSPHSRNPGSPRESNGRRSLLPVFKCQWENCDQELQNLDTLRRHLVKKHKIENNQGVLPCCWGDCGSLIPILSQDPETGKKIIKQHRKRINFGTGAAWDNHVLGEHLKLVKDQLGEGMSVKGARSVSRGSSAHSVEGRIRSMSRDRNGRSITPVITPAPFGYKFTPPPGFSSNSQFRLAHELDNGLPNEQKILGEELARAERTGAGMEFYGTSMVPGIDYDDAKGYATKSKKLTKDLSVLPAIPVPKADKAKKDNEGIGK
ncbi:hypothetical protein TWF696_005793 [Orbilia brochopaga]|uniref:C2H2-type domain-containing protein n=1 Tax=Orbilia brochopaga TaxID=3140254 RepID=A0AAV9UV52_9PEZI